MNYIDQTPAAQTEPVGYQNAYLMDIRDFFDNLLMPLQVTIDKMTDDEYNSAGIIIESLLVKAEMTLEETAFRLRQKFGEGLSLWISARGDMPSRSGRVLGVDYE